MNHTVTTTTTDPHQHLADLQARIAAGDTKITAAQLADARAAAELAELQTVSAERRAADQAAAEREELQQQFRADLDTQLAHIDDVRTAYSEAVTALASLNDSIRTWQHHRGQLTQRGHALGLADEATATLPDLSTRDWVTVANDEAHGKFDPAPRRKIQVGTISSSSTSAHPHVLHDANARARIEQHNYDTEAARIARIQQRETDKADERQRIANAHAAVLEHFEQRDQQDDR
jgi:hypothetical protein